MIRNAPRTAVLTLLALLALSAALPALAQTAQLTFDDLFDADRTGRVAGSLDWRPTGDGSSHALTYLWDAGDGEALWQMDRATGEATALVAVSELGRFGDDLAIDSYQWSPSGDALLVESADDLFLWRAGDEWRRLTETEDAEEAPVFSPDGTRVAFVRRANLYLLDLADGSERALTSDGEPGRILNGTTDWVYWEEIWGRSATAFWWSPDGRRIAYYRFDDTPVGAFTLLPDPTPPYPAPRVQRYPKAGTANPLVRVGVLDVASGETVWLDTAVAPERAETYLARVHWRPDSAAVAIERLNREQTDLDLLSCSPTAGSCRTLLQEHLDTWVNVGDDTHLLADGRILWASERSGWRHLYLYSGKGELVRQLTSGAWSVASVDHAGADAAIVTAYGTGPLGAASRRLLRVPYDGGAVQELTDATGWHTADVSPDGALRVHGWSDANRPGWRRLETAAGTAIAELPTTAPAFEPETLPAWRIFTIPGPQDGERSNRAVELPAAMLLPPGLDPENPGSRKLPVVMYHYGCPSSQVVADRWGRRGRSLWYKLMAQRGYVVLMVDNQESFFFGKTGEDRAHRLFGPDNLMAQLAAVDYLKGLPFVDPGRIGIWGWSGGGSNTLGALLGSPGTWKAGVAGAPVTDWRYYDTIWTERYLDHPEDNAEGYRLSSPVTYAENLADALLIIHGTADDNVHPQNTLAMADALTKAGKPFEMAIYPGQKHGFRGAAERHVYERMTAFFDRELKGK